MYPGIAAGMLAVSVALLLPGCPSVGGKRAADAAAPTGAQSYAGWYMQHGGQGSFRACGQSRSWRVATAGELPARAKAFGLDEDTPVYVRIQGIQGIQARDAIDVARVEQFGSTTPVRDCPMTGVVIHPTPPH